MSEQPKTMAEQLRAAGIKVREPSGQGVVIANPVIDLAVLDAGRHWLHPSQKLRGNERVQAIREKHRQRHRDKRSKQR